MASDLDIAKQEGQDLTQMYQAGFIDGYYTKHPILNNAKKRIKYISEQCKKCFELRFMNKINVKVVENEQKKFIKN